MTEKARCEREGYCPYCAQIEAYPDDTLPDPHPAPDKAGVRLVEEARVKVELAVDEARNLATRRRREHGV